ncbi:MAG: hypothetical protein SOT10_07700 [Oscillospiraceae bacterium]|nr:hypothetical protein [Oscillospiraceae bacterium]
MTLGQVWLDAEKEEVLKLLKVTGNLTKSQKIWKKIIYICFINFILETIISIECFNFSNTHIQIYGGIFWSLRSIIALIMLLKVSYIILQGNKLIKKQFINNLYTIYWDDTANVIIFGKEKIKCSCIEYIYQYKNFIFIYGNEITILLKINNTDEDTIKLIVEKYNIYYEKSTEKFNFITDIPIKKSIVEKMQNKIPYLEKAIVIIFLIFLFMSIAFIII